MRYPDLLLLLMRRVGAVSFDQAEQLNDKQSF